MSRRRLRSLGPLLVVLLAGAPACTDSEPDPERVLLVGDSIMNQVAQQVRTLPHEGMDIRNEAVNGSGLLSPWQFDWETHMTRILADYEPDLVVFLFIGNYPNGEGRVAEAEDGRPIRHQGSRPFFAAWQRQAEALTREAAEVAEVIWVLPPPMKTRENQNVVDGLRAGYRSVADEVDGVRTIDAYEVLATENGRYDARAPGPGDDQARLRRRDGVHLAPLGSERLALLVDSAIVAG